MFQGACSYICHKALMLTSSFRIRAIVKVLFFVRVLLIHSFKTTLTCRRAAAFALSPAVPCFFKPHNTQPGERRRTKAPSSFEWKAFRFVGPARHGDQAQ